MKPKGGEKVMPNLLNESKYYCDKSFRWPLRTATDMQLTAQMLNESTVQEEKTDDMFEITLKTKKKVKKPFRIFA